MKVFIKSEDTDLEYDSDDKPIIILLSHKDREKILNCPPGQLKYCVYPDKGYTHQDILDWADTIK